MFEKENLIKIENLKIISEHVCKIDEKICKIDEKVNVNVENQKTDAAKMTVSLDSIKTFTDLKINESITNQNNNQKEISEILKIIEVHQNMVKTNTEQIDLLNKDLSEFKAEMNHVKTNWLGVKTFQIQMPYLNYNERHLQSGYDPMNDFLRVDSYKSLATSLYHQVI